MATPRPDKERATSNCSPEPAVPKMRSPRLNTRIPMVIKGRRPYLSENTPMGTWGIAMNTMNEPIIMPIMGLPTSSSPDTAGSMGIRDRIDMKTINNPPVRMNMILVRGSLEQSSAVWDMVDRKLMWLIKFS